MTIVDQVKNWYRENVQRFGESLSKVNINSNTADPVRGAVVIEMETRALVASITFWNKGDVCVLGLHKQTKEVPMYALLVDKNGPKFRESQGDGESKQLAKSKLTRQWTWTTMAQFAEVLDDSNSRMDRTRRTLH